MGPKVQSSPKQQGRQLWETVVSEIYHMLEMLINKCFTLGLAAGKLGILIVNISPELVIVTIVSCITFGLKEISSL